MRVRVRAWWAPARRSTNPIYFWIASSSAATSRSAVSINWFVIFENITWFSVLADAERGDFPRSRCFLLTVFLSRSPGARIVVNRADFTLDGPREGNLTGSNSGVKSAKKKKWSQPFLTSQTPAGCDECYTHLNKASLPFYLVNLLTQWPTNYLPGNWMADGENVHLLKVLRWKIVSSPRGRDRLAAHRLPQHAWGRVICGFRLECRSSRWSDRGSDCTASAPHFTVDEIEPRAGWLAVRRDLAEVVAASFSLACSPRLHAAETN